MAQKILIIEDDVDLAGLLNVRLKSEGFQVSLAYDGEEGLDKAADQPDMIILDLILPKIDGLQVLRSLKNDPQTHGIPVVVLTAKAESETIMEATNSGSFDYLIKPFDTKELLDVIRRALKLARK